MSGCNYQEQPTCQRANGLFHYCMATINHQIYGLQKRKGYCPKTCNSFYEKVTARSVVVTLTYLLTYKMEEV